MVCVAVCVCDGEEHLKWGLLNSPFSLRLPELKELDIRKKNICHPEKAGLELITATREDPGLSRRENKVHFPLHCFFKIHLAVFKNFLLAKFLQLALDFSPLKLSSLFFSFLKIVELLYPLDKCPYLYLPDSESEELNESSKNIYWGKSNITICVSCLKV